MLAGVKETGPSADMFREDGRGPFLNGDDGQQFR